MMEDMIKKRLSTGNQVSIAGMIQTGFIYDHQAFGENFYMTNLLVKRASGIADKIPVMFSDRFIDVTKNYVGKNVEIKGQIRSYNYDYDNSRHLKLFVFCSEVKIVGLHDQIYNNQIFFDGYVCKQPIYRQTPLGREITELVLAVNRPYNKSDYIPCICWGNNARYASAFKIGRHVLMQGRIQSREYIKQTEMEAAERRLAYEVSVSQIA